MLSMTLGFTLCGFLTCETPCTPLPIPADYPDLCQGCGFLAGMGIGHCKVTQGLPMPITSVAVHGSADSYIFISLHPLIHRSLDPVISLFKPTISVTDYRILISL